MWFVLKDFTLSIPFSEHNVSYLCVSGEKIKPIIEHLRQLIKDLLTNKQFSIEVLSESFIMLDSENLPVRCIVLMAFFWIINTLLIEPFVWTQTIEA